MDTSLQLTHVRVDDVPLPLGFLIKLRFPQLLDQLLEPHPLHQGLSRGRIITVRIAYILSHADHRKAHVRHRVEEIQRALEASTGQTIRDRDFTDDRLTLVLARLSDTTLWDRLEAALWGATCEAYALPVDRVRLDRTTSYGLHTIVPDGLMPQGHSKDHRPDLPQLQLMAAAAEPGGQLLAGTVHPGDAADDPLYLPIIARVRALLGRTGLLDTGDCTMAALETRAEIAARGDFSLTPPPMTGEAKDLFTTRVEDAVSGPRRDDLVTIRIGEDTLGTGSEFTRDRTATVEGAERTWEERVQVVRSDSLAETQMRAWSRRLEKAEAAVRTLTPPPGRGKVRFTTGWELGPAADAVLVEHEVVGLLEVSWAEEQTSRTPYVGRGRGGPGRPKKTEWTIRQQITTARRNEPAPQERYPRMGRRVQVTNVPEGRLSLGDSVIAYRGGRSLERDFHLLKDRPLGISPLDVRRDDQVVGLTHLLTLALRVLTLFEALVRRGQKRQGEELTGLYPGQKSRTTDRPTATRVLSAIAGCRITVTRVEEGDGCRWHLTPLPDLLRRVLAYLGLPEAVYTRLIINSS